MLEYMYVLEVGLHILNIGYNMKVPECSPIYFSMARLVLICTMLMEAHPFKAYPTLLTDWGNKGLRPLITINFG